MKETRCVACGEKMDRGSRDHVFPEALGSFRKAFICLRFCQICNGEAGKLETSLFHESFFTGIRDYLGIRSRKSRKQPFVDQVKRLRDRGKTDISDVKVMRDGIEVRPDFSSDGTPSVNLPPIAELRYEDGQIEIIELTGLSPVQIADRLGLVLRKKRLQILIKSNDDLAQIVALLADKGFSAPEPIQLEPLTGGMVRTRGLISGELNSRHIRAMGFMLLKAMLFVGYQPEDLIRLTDFVFHGRTTGISFDVRSSKSPKPSLFQIDQHNLIHSIQWNAGQGSLFGTVSPFMNIDHLIGVIFKVEYPIPKKVLAPPFYPGRGYVRAVYDRLVRGSNVRPGAGECFMWIDQSQSFKMP